MNATPAPLVVTPAHVFWREDGTPYSPAFGDVFHAAAGGSAQCDHVFIDGNNLPQRWQSRAPLCVGEIGFGSGLNLLRTATRFLAEATPDAQLSYWGVDAHPWSLSDTRRLLATAAIHPELQREWLEQLPRLQPGSNRLHLAAGRIRLTLLVADVATALAESELRVDAWYLDGFSPAQPSPIWTERLYQWLYASARPGATLATWCCAGAVRRGLQAAGFVLERRPGFAGKREMLCAQRPQVPQNPARPTRVQVVGAGLSGCWVARELAERGLAVELLERAAGPATGASQMPFLVVRPYARHRDTPTARFFWQAAWWATQRLSQLGLPGWREQPVWRAYADEEPHFLQPAGWCDGPTLCTTLLDHPGIDCRWQVELDAHAPLSDAPRIWCTATAVGYAGSILRAIRGQQSLWPAGRGQWSAQDFRVGDSVAAESALGLLFGASRVFDDSRDDLRPEEALDYGASLPRPPQAPDLAAMQHWAGIRQQSRDRLPLIGPAPRPFAEQVPPMPAGRASVDDLPSAPQQWLNLAHGARGATSAPLAAALLADQLLDEPKAVLRGERWALDPRRFLLRDWRRGQRPD